MFSATDPSTIIFSLANLSTNVPTTISPSTTFLNHFLTFPLIQHLINNMLNTKNMSRGLHSSITTENGNIK